MRSFAVLGLDNAGNQMHNFQRRPLPVIFSERTAKRNDALFRWWFPVVLATAPFSALFARIEPPLYLVFNSTIVNEGPQGARPRSNCTVIFNRWYGRFAKPLITVIKRPFPWHANAFFGKEDFPVWRIESWLFQHFYRHIPLICEEVFFQRISLVLIKIELRNFQMAHLKKSTPTGSCM